MFSHRLAAFVLAVLTTSALAGLRDDAPPIKDPYEGLLPLSVIKPGDKGPVADAGSKRLAIVLSGNANTHLKWSEEAASEGRSGADRFFGTMFAGAGRVAEHDKMIAQAYRSQVITAAILQPLIDTFKEVKVMNDFAEFRDSGFEMAVLLDIAFVNTFFDSPVFIGNKYETGVKIKAHFIDAGFASGPVIDLSRSRQVGRNSFVEEVLALRSAALADYTAEVRKVLGPARAQPAAAGPGALQPAAAVPAADRLRQLEQLKRDGLITEQEAAQKRKQILEGM